ncbi:MAG TPA: electron transfer flavoprotein subunit alpha/FixB family protein [Ktedonobacterales bacterium]|nr:electron transfer flavoprotein subunit alpha/FixB family protein [Ktedonobacterales bacterium]
MANDVWALAEITGGKLTSISLQLASKAAELAGQLGGSSAAVAMGTSTAAAAADLGSCGVKTVYAADGAVYDEYLIQPHVETLAALVEQHQPAVILFGVTNYGRDVAARLAARLGLGLEYNVAEVTVEGGDLAMIVPAFGGAQSVKTAFTGGGTKLVGARPNAFPTNRVGGSAEVVNVPAASAPANGAKLSGPFGAEGAAEAGHLGKAPDGHDMWLPAATRAKLEEAQIIVSGGRGLGGPQGFEQIEALASALGAGVGASRAAVDAGWIPYAHQVGQTGKTVKPTVYIACGISGAVQHKAGMGSSALIIAINKDKDAPIFGFCDLGVVGDLNAIVPQLTEKVRQRKG